jgi:hypothetical protein
VITRVRSEGISQCYLPSPPIHPRTFGVEQRRVGDEITDEQGGAGGDDRLQDGPDGDRLAGGPGNDFMKGKRGSDVMKGKKGIDRIRAKDGLRDVKISCGPGTNRLEKAIRDRRLDPKPRSC